MNKVCNYIINSFAVLGAGYYLIKIILRKNFHTKTMKQNEYKNINTSGPKTFRGGEG